MGVKYCGRHGGRTIREDCPCIGCGPMGRVSDNYCEEKCQKLPALASRDEWLCAAMMDKCSKCLEVAA